MAGLWPLLVEQARSSYVLLTGNNFPKDASPDPNFGRPQFWKNLASLGAEVIALGQEDFLRAALPAYPQAGPCKPMRGPAEVGFSAHWLDQLRTGGRYHFLATNAAIRKHEGSLNLVRSGAYRLVTSPDESLSQVTGKLSIEGPAGASSNFWVVPTSGPKPTEPAKTTWTGTAFRSATVEVTLKPGNRIA